MESSNGSDADDDEENKKPAAVDWRKKQISGDTKKAPPPKLAPINPEHSDDYDDDSLRPDTVTSQNKNSSAFKKKDYPLKLGNVPIKQEDSEDDAFGDEAIDSSKKGSTAKKKDPPPKVANVPIKQEDSEDTFFGHNAFASFLDSVEDPVPPPPPLYRVTGQSTLFNTYTATWDPMDAAGPSSSPRLPHSTGFAELLSPNPLFGFAAAHGLTDTSFHDPFETACAELASKKPSPKEAALSSGSAKSGASGITSMMARAGLSGSVVSTEEEPVVDLTDPTSRIIQTAHGPALLLSPSVAKNPISNKNEPARRFQRWSEEEDLLLKAAVDLEGKPTDWKRVASKYFLNSRNSSQCKGRWKKVNYFE